MKFSFDSKQHPLITMLLMMLCCSVQSKEPATFSPEHWYSSSPTEFNLFEYQKKGPGLQELTLGSSTRRIISSRQVWSIDWPEEQSLWSIQNADRRSVAEGKWQTLDTCALEQTDCSQSSANNEAQPLPEDSTTRAWGRLLHMNGFRDYLVVEHQLLGCCYRTTISLYESAVSETLSGVEPGAALTVAYFEPGQYSISEQDEYNLHNLVQVLSNHEGTLEITGYADRSGPSPLNRQLSAKRAQAVYQSLVNAGLSNTHIHMTIKAGLTDSHTLPAKTWRKVTVTWIEKAGPDLEEKQLTLR